MAELFNQARVFLSYIHSDREYARKLRELLLTVGFDPVDPETAVAMGDYASMKIREQISDSSTIIVLIGPSTRKSKWVDFEIKTSISGRRERSGPGLIALVLPTHNDFSKPYYDPTLIPLRLHDLIAQDFALLRKWTEDRSQICQWLEEAQGRRQRIRTPSISFKTSFALREFDWDESVDDLPRQQSK